MPFAICQGAQLFFIFFDSSIFIFSSENSRPAEAEALSASPSPRRGCPPPPIPLARTRNKYKFHQISLNFSNFVNFCGGYVFISPYNARTNGAQMPWHHSSMPEATIQGPRGERSCCREKGRSMIKSRQNSVLNLKVGIKDPDIRRSPPPPPQQS